MFIIYYTYIAWRILWMIVMIKIVLLLLLFIYFFICIENNNNKKRNRRWIIEISLFLWKYFILYFVVVVDIKSDKKNTSLKIIRKKKEEEKTRKIGKKFISSMFFEMRLFQVNLPWEITWYELDITKFLLFTWHTYIREKKTSFPVMSFIF